MQYALVKRLIEDNKKYYEYALYSAKANLKSEVAGSYLSWLWWILDPLLFMLIYIFIAEIVFKKTEAFFPVFVIIGLTVWNFFNKVVTQSIKLMKSNRGIITKVYLPKHILLLQSMITNGFKMGISFGLVLSLMILLRVPFSYHIIYVIPYILVLCVLTYGIGCICLHLGVFIEDLQNVAVVGLRLAFYLSGIFYDITENVPAPYNRWLLIGNPVAFVINGCRNALLYQIAPEWKYIVLWILVAFILIYVSIWFIYKYENSYGKVL